jgi:short-subunit dehydrogenase
VERELGPIDVWVNNAMATIYSPFADITPEEYRRATEVTYLGTVHGTLAALKRMRERDRGTIVQVGSALAYRAIPLQSAYCGAKFAVRGFTDSLRSELLHDGSRVRLTMVQLSAFNTPQFDWARTHIPKRTQPVPPIFQPEIAAEAIVWAAREPRREVWVGFPAVKTILAQKIAPALLDRLLAHMGYEGQITDEREPASRPDNLYAPLPGDHGAHGRFDNRARERSWQIWVSRHRAAVATGMMALVAAALVLAA